MSYSARKSSYVFEYRIAFMGEDGVGKSALINQIVEKKFIEKYNPTVSNHLTHVVEFEGHLCVCLLVDTAGVADFPAMRKLAISKGNAFVVVYAVDNRKSFETAKNLIREIKLLKGTAKETRVVLVGNKKDLPRTVTYKEGLDYSKMVQEDNCVSTFIEASAKERESSTEILYKILNMFLPPIKRVEEYNNLKKKPSLYSSTLSNRRSSKSLIRRKQSCGSKNETTQKDKVIGDLEGSVFETKSSPTGRFRSRSKSHPIISVKGILETLSPKTSKRKFSANATLFSTNTRRVSLPQNNFSPKTNRPVYYTHSTSLNSSSLEFSNSLTSMSSHDSGLGDTIRHDSGLSDVSNKKTLSEIHIRLTKSLSEPPRSERRTMKQIITGIFKSKKTTTNFSAGVKS
ncbi:uncharacterized protein LOC105847544 [Hydra vulgaris]|uniref:Uncharacterized protein LOC105847544 n=1 Tax=Hydra vulgaris TaxID=6087 RepID=A0ABM4B5D6_HYDVU